MPSHLSPVLFGSSAARISIFHISNSLGTELLDDYIGLIANQKLRTELFVLSFLLKDRVYPADLWELVGERSIEAKQEETLRLHQNSCTGGDDRSHAIVERLLIEERRKRCQIEVSLYSQAIERIKQHRTPLTCTNDPATHKIRMPSAMPKKEVASLACPTATQEMCEAWLTRNEACLIPAAEPLIENFNFSPLDGSTASVLDHSATAKLKSAILNDVTPSLPLLNTWVTVNAQKTFDEAFTIELTSQAELMAKSLTNKRDSAFMRTVEKDLLTLQAKMRRAEAEIELYTLAIENTHEFNFSDNSSSTSSDQSIRQPLSEEVYRHEDVDDGTDEDYHFW